MRIMLLRGAVLGTGTEPAAAGDVIDAPDSFALRLIWSGKAKPHDGTPHAGTSAPPPGGATDDTAAAG